MFIRINKLHYKAFGCNQRTSLNPNSVSKKNKLIINIQKITLQPIMVQKYHKSFPFLFHYFPLLMIFLQLHKMYEILFLMGMDVDHCGSIIEFHLNEHMLGVRVEPEKIKL